MCMYVYMCVFDFSISSHSFIQSIYNTFVAFMKKRVDAVELSELLKRDENLRKKKDLYLDPRMDTIIGHLEGGFVKNKDEMFRKAANLMVHSLYPPAILHWMRVLGNESVMVVPSEKLRVSKRGGNNKELKDTLDKVYKFLGLCPFGKLPEAVVHETRDPEGIKDEAVLNHTMISMLEVFFAPYNQILSVMTNGEVSYDRAFNLPSRSLEFRPSYEWKQLLPWHTTPNGVETRLPVGMCWFI